MLDDWFNHCLMNYIVEQMFDDWFNHYLMNYSGEQIFGQLMQSLLDELYCWPMFCWLMNKQLTGSSICLTTQFSDCLPVTLVSPDSSSPSSCCRLVPCSGSLSVSSSTTSSKDLSETHRIAAWLTLVITLTYLRQCNYASPRPPCLDPATFQH